MSPIASCFMKNFHLRDSSDPQRAKRTTTPEQFAQVLVCLPSGIDSLPTTSGPYGAAVLLLELFSISHLLVVCQHLPAVCLIAASVDPSLSLSGCNSEPILHIYEVTTESIRGIYANVVITSVSVSIPYHIFQIHLFFFLCMIPQFFLFFFCVVFPISTQCPVKTMYLQIWRFLIVLNEDQRTFSSGINGHI